MVAVFLFTSFLIFFFSFPSFFVPFIFLKFTFYTVDKILFIYTIREALHRITFDSLKTAIKTSATAGSPTPFSAVHLQPPASSLPVIVKGKVVKRPSLSLFQVTLGFGLPSALQISVTFSFRFAVWLPEMQRISEGAV